VHPVYGVHRPRGGGDSPVHHGPDGGTPHWSGARGQFRARLLAARVPRGKEGRGDTHRGRRWAAPEGRETGDEVQLRWLFAPDDKRLGRGRDKGENDFGRGGIWPRCRGLL
jgi:hypothetical protein